MISIRQHTVAACLVLSASLAIGAGGVARAGGGHDGHSDNSGSHTTGVVDRSIGRQVVAVTRATARYHDVRRALGDGYEAFTIPPDVGGTPTNGRGLPGNPTCFDSVDGGMGVHYVQGLDGALDPAHPEALVYEIDGHGRLDLVAVEYIVPNEFVDPENPPTMMGQELHAHPYLPVFVLHAWVWRTNPDGLFTDYNPTVASCAAAAGHSVGATRVS